MTDVASALRAIDTIVEPGEGAPGHHERSHYARLVGVRDELDALLRERDDFAPARPVGFSQQGIAFRLLSELAGRDSGSAMRALRARRRPLRGRRPRGGTDADGRSACRAIGEIHVLPLAPVLPADVLDGVR